MNSQEIQQHKEAFDQVVHLLDESGVDCCFARALMNPLGYDQWKNFSNSEGKAKLACQNSKIETIDHFRKVTKKVSVNAKYIENLAVGRRRSKLVAIVNVRYLEALYFGS